MKLRTSPIPMTIALLGVHAAAFAQASAAVPRTAAEPLEAAPDAVVKEGIVKVEVKGSQAGYDPRREDTASKTILTRDEILKYGDSNVFDVLKRAPGVTVIGNGIRMRGLGNGYTQVLVNGERPPPGFSMDALMPDQIERIEVIRAATAEHSMQAIAGTINIILTRIVSKPQRDLRLGVSRSSGQRNELVNATFADRSGQLSYYVNGMFSHSADKKLGNTLERLAGPDGQLLQLREKRLHTSSNNTTAGLQPRLHWKLDDGGQLTWSAFLQGQRSEGDSYKLTTTSIGTFARPDYRDSAGSTDVREHFAGTDLNWVRKLWGGKLDAKIGVSSGSAKVESGMRSIAADALLRRVTDTENDFSNITSSGKYSRSMFEGHALAMGWEAAVHRVDTIVDRVEGLAGTAPTNIHETFTPRVKRLAVFAQDEWNITKQWSMYLGARWEGIRTESAGAGVVPTESRSQVLSPVAQTLYKFPDKNGRQLRMALTRTYKAPNTYQLSARRYEADHNDRFNPDNSGNPRLRPELADGVDVTYEHFWAPSALFSVGGSVRRIKDYIRNRLVLDAQGRWLIQPLNNGNAQVRSLEVELKFPLTAVLGGGPPMDLRASFNRNWSSVDYVPGPDNRLDQQIPFSAVLGMDYKEGKLTMGSTFSYQRGGPVRISMEQSSWTQARRELVAFVQYKVRPDMQLLAAVTNALGEDYISHSRYADAGGTSQVWSSTPASAKLKVNLELKF